MTDDPPDLRDERVAERLRVEPLDEVTRARLVRTAMAGAPATSSNWSIRTRVLGIAAALVVVLAVGFAVLARNASDSGTTSTAARAPKADSLERSRQATEELGQGQEFSAGSGVLVLGGVGDVGSKAALRRAVGAIGDAAAPAVDAPAAAADSAPTAAESDRSVTVTVCDTGAIARLGEVLAVGTGTADGEPVTVYVVERPNGSRVGVVVGPDCAVGKPVLL